jgi:hypothetical protein
MEKMDDETRGNTTEAIDEEVFIEEEILPPVPSALPLPPSSAPRSARERYLRKINKAHLT